MPKFLKKKELDFNEWLEIGFNSKFCSLPACATHDGIPSHETEEEAFMEGSDPCQVIVRLGQEEDWVWDFVGE